MDSKRRLTDEALVIPGGTPMPEAFHALLVCINELIERVRTLEMHSVPLIDELRPTQAKDW